MTPIFEYFDLYIGLDKAVNNPLEFVCSRDNYKAIAKLDFRDGLFHSIRFSEMNGFSMLDSEDLDLVHKILENNLNSAVKNWIEFHVYELSIQFEKITVKI
jgi:hypothetical protein